MKKYVILSVNDNPNYLYHVPLVCWAWRKIGWEPIIFYHGPVTRLFAHAVNEQPLMNIRHLAINAYRSDTNVQVSRLYGACVADGYIMTGDIDMIPLSDYWHPPDQENITVWGHDLTGYGHYPICYIGMPSTRWVEVMGLTSIDYDAHIKRDLDSLPQASSQNSVTRWVTDQDLITQRINATQFKVNHISRGTLNNGYAKGRIDRSAWSLDVNPYIDCHIFHDVHKNDSSFKKTMDMLHTVWPNENWLWFLEYTKEFKKLL